MSKRAGELSATVRRQVVAANEKQLSRIGGCNDQMKAKELREHCKMGAGAKDLLEAAVTQFNLSGKGYDRTLKVSRATADLEGMSEHRDAPSRGTINYRAFDRKLFGKEAQRKPGSNVFTDRTRLGLTI